MGFIGKIFGAIFGFIGSLFGSIAKLFGLGSKSDYYLEIDDAKAGTSAPEVKQGTQKEAMATEASPAASSASTSSASAPSTPASATTSVDLAAKPERSEAARSAAPVASPAVAKASQNGKAVSTATFAPDNLLPLASTGGRRRPGPSLSPFKDMARQVQRPNKA